MIMSPPNGTEAEEGQTFSKNFAQERTYLRATRGQG